MSASFVNINVPFVAPLQSDGAANLQTVQQDTYALGAADVVLTGVLSPEIINAFLISHEDASDSAVALNVTMQGKNDFMNALSAAIKAATISTADAAIHPKYTGPAAVQGAGTHNGLLLVNYIKAALHTDVIVALNNNTIAAELEASDVQEITLPDYDADCLAAAEDMYDGLVGIEESLRRVIATQVGNTRFTDVSEGFTSALPLTSGDSMTFQFNLTSNLTISESVQDVVSGADTNNGSGPGVGTYLPSTSNILGSNTRVVRVRLVKP
jgi:hypothetical protein